MLVLNKGLHLRSLLSMWRMKDTSPMNSTSRSLLLVVMAIWCKRGMISVIGDGKVLEEVEGRRISGDRGKQRNKVTLLFVLIG